MIFIVDLDDTIIKTTPLNNESYNYALEQCGYNRINTNKRLTKVVLSNYKNLEKIIEIKQQYFIKNCTPNKLTLNKNLIEKIKKNGKENCYVWTSADTERTNMVLDLCKLRQYFKDVIFDKKENFKASITFLKQKLQASEFIIYEDNADLFKNENATIANIIKDKNFNIVGYLIK